MRASNSAAGNPPRSLCSFVFVSLPPENLPVQENGKKNSLAFLFCKLLPIFEGKSVWMPRIHCLEEKKSLVIVYIANGSLGTFTSVVGEGSFVSFWSRLETVQVNIS